MLAIRFSEFHEWQLYLGIRGALKIQGKVILPQVD